MRHFLIGFAVLGLTACQPADDTGTDMVAPPAAGEAEPGPPSQPVEPPAAYIGAWVADLAWCANTTGPERPIRVTATEFQGYENTCQITELQPTDAGWTAVFVCSAEGQTTNRPVGISADDGRLEITWMDEGYSVDWRRCPA